MRSTLTAGARRPRCALHGTPLELDEPDPYCLACEAGEPPECHDCAVPMVEVAEVCSICSRDAEHCLDPFGHDGSADEPGPACPDCHRALRSGAS